MIEMSKLNRFEAIWIDSDTLKKIASLTRVRPDDLDHLDGLDSLDGLDGPDGTDWTMVSCFDVSSTSRKDTEKCSSGASSAVAQGEPKGHNDLPALKVLIAFSPVLMQMKLVDANVKLERHASFTDIEHVWNTRG